MNLKKILSLLVALLMLASLLVGCGEKPADVTTTTASEVTTTLADEVTTTVADDVTTTVADGTTTVGDEVTTVGGEDPTTTEKNDPTTAGKQEPTTAGNKTTTKKPDVTTKKPETTTKKVTTTTTKKTTTTTTTAPTTQKVYGETMYVDWNPETRMLQVVQKYSSTHDLVSIIKPIAPNNILNFVSPKLIANTKSDISSDLSKAKHWYAMPESDWLGPHMINGDWHGHGSNPTGYTDGVVLKVNGKATNGNVGTYAGEINLSYTNYLWNSSTKKVFMTEHYSLTFDGEVWSVECNLKMLENASGWSSYYGMQCTYGAWQDSIQYGDEAPVSIAAAAGNTKASSKKCDTMILRNNNGHALEMKMDRTYGLGKGNYITSSSAGAFTAAYPHPNGKAYFLLVNDGRNPPKNAKFMWRGTYRFFCEE